MKVPYLDLEAHHRPYREEFLRSIGEVIDSAAFAGGPYVETFEREFAEYCGTRHAIGVGNGTEALFFALLALDVGAGDEVISPPNTFVAIAEAVERCGAKLVFVDIDERTYNLDPRLLEAAITKRTKVIVPAHLFGQIADMDAILKIAQAHGVKVLEDAAQAHGARYRGKRAGRFGVAATFSFYPGKNLGALGEAGAVVTDDDAIAEKILVLRNHGQSPKAHHALVGWNGRMDGIQAAVLSIKLRNLDRSNGRRCMVAQRYREQLAGLDDLVLPYADARGEHVYHIFAVRAPERDRLMRSLERRGIGCSVHYPICIHLQEAYRGLGYQLGDFPIAERCAASLISLPMYPELEDEQIDYVCSALAEELPVRKIAAS